MTAKKHHRGTNLQHNLWKIKPMTSLATICSPQRGSGFPGGIAPLPHSPDAHCPWLHHCMKTNTNRFITFVS